MAPEDSTVDPDDFIVEFRRNGDRLVIRLAGEVDLQSEPVLRPRLERALQEAPPSTVVVDMSAVSFLDSTGIGMLLTARLDAQARGATFSLAGTTPAQVRLLTMAGLAEIFELSGTEPDGGS